MTCLAVFLLSGSLILFWALDLKGEPAEMDKLRKLLALVLIGAVISLGGLGCEKKEAAPVDKTETSESKTEEKSADHPEGEHPEGEEHPKGEHPE